MGDLMILVFSPWFLDTLEYSYGEKPEISYGPKLGKDLFTIAICKENELPFSP